MGHEELRELFGKQRTLEILELLESDGTLNYTDIERRISTSSDVVSDRLATLVEYELLTRNEQSPKNIRYSITEKGKQILEQTRNLEELLDG
jgi:DNA-binding HxlR family transcriptional regulator